MSRFDLERILAIFWGYKAPPPSRIGIILSRLYKVVFSTVAGALGAMVASAPFSQLVLEIGRENRYYDSLILVGTCIGLVTGAIIGFRCSWDGIASFGLILLGTFMAAVALLP
jgi:hypothetical protein